jgi:hypothetical protein
LIGAQLVSLFAHALSSGHLPVSVNLGIIYTDCLPILVFFLSFSFKEKKRTMYPQPGAPMAPPQKPETFMLSTEAQQSLPHDAQVALQQVDNCMSLDGSPVSRLRIDSSQ